MKKIILFSIFLFSCSENQTEFPFSDLSLDEALALKSDKIIFLDFYSDT